MYQKLYLFLNGVSLRIIILELGASIPEMCICQRNDKTATQTYQMIGL